MEWLQQLAESSNIPLLTAFALGLIMATSPCPLALNITATAWLSKELSDKRRVLLNCLFYTLGGMSGYTALASFIYLGTSKLRIARWLQHIDSFWVGVALVVFGVLMFDFIRLNLPLFNKITSSISSRNLKRNYWNAFLIGIVFALTFCPYSAVLYFGGLIPLSVASASGLLLPSVFAFAACLPVIVVAFLLAYSVASLGKFYNRIKSFEKWFKRIVAVIFIAAGFFLIIKNI